MRNASYNRLSPWIAIPILTLALSFASCKSDGGPLSGCSTGSLGGCPSSDGYPNPYEGQLELLSWTETLRKASLELTGKLPTAQQIRATEEQGQLGLEGALAEMMRDEAFIFRLKELYNDHFLTNKYLGQENAISLLDEEVYPNLRWFETTGSGDEMRELINDSIAREALELIAHVVRNDRPFTEILTANYTVANGYSAPSFIGIPDIPLQINDDPARYREIRIPGVPHAGILTSPMFLNRFPTSDTNRNRHRSRMAYKFFLDIDINEFGARPVDINNVGGDNPTLNDPNCTICHTTMDPAAGAFQNWDERGIYDANGWYDDMLPPGFAGKTMPPEEFPRALQWFAREMAKHPAFALATVHTMFNGMTGQKAFRLQDYTSDLDPIDPPADGGVDGGADGGADGGVDGGADGGTDGGVPDPDPDPDPDLGPLQRAEAVQEGMLETMRVRFVQSNYNLKILVREIVLTPYFRAKNSTPLAPDMEVELSTFGTARFLTPEHLARKIEATTGVRWRRSSNSEDYLLDDYRFFYGGIDSDLVTQRVTAPNGVMASLAQRMAYEVACSAVPYDFSKPANERLLFPSINMDTPPSASSDETREAVRHLHSRIVGENLDINDEEITQTINLLMEVWNLGQSGFADQSVSEQLVGQCSLTRDRNTDADLPQSRYVTQDPQYNVRAWMAVVSYLLADYRFIYE